MALINFNGSVDIIFPCPSLRTRCEMNVWNFPFDKVDRFLNKNLFHLTVIFNTPMFYEKQNCSIVVSTWAYSNSTITFNQTSEFSTEFYLENSVWKLNGLDFKIIDQRDRYQYWYSEEYPMEAISYTLMLERRPLYFLITGILIILSSLLLQNQ
jgi:hypothetical protein